VVNKKRRMILTRMPLGDFIKSFCDLEKEVGLEKESSKSENKLEITTELRGYVNKIKKI